jgi:hypothetical protein
MLAAVACTPQQWSSGGGSIVCCTIKLLLTVVLCRAVLCCVGLQEQQLYPCVGMRTKHEEVRANFGGAPFCVDLNKLHVSEIPDARLSWSILLTTPAHF